MYLSPPFGACPYFGAVGRGCDIVCGSEIRRVRRYFLQAFQAVVLGIVQSEDAVVPSAYPHPLPIVGADGEGGIGFVELIVGPEGAFCRVISQHTAAPGADQQVTRGQFGDALHGIAPLLFAASVGADDRGVRVVEVCEGVLGRVVDGQSVVGAHIQGAGGGGEQGVDDWWLLRGRS